MKRYLLSLSFLAIATYLMAQSGTNSPYSMFGLGKLAEQSVGASRGMNGVGIAFQDHNIVNTLNPASYSAIDSTTFLFDVAMSLQNTNYRENGTSRNAKNADFEYAVGAFRLVRHVGMSFGILPFSNIGYEFTSSTNVDDYVIAPAMTTTTTMTKTYEGEGGVHEIFVGAGWATPIKGLSVGMNAGYVWGSIARYSTSSYSDGYARSLAKQYGAEIHSYKLDFGLQYTHALGKNYQGTFGFTFAPKHVLHSDAACLVLAANSQTSVNDSVEAEADNSMDRPMELGFGFALAHSNNWKVGLDYMMQCWKNASFPVYEEINGVPYYNMVNNYYYSNRHTIKVGGEYCKNEMGREFVSRLRYRFGFGYSSSYLKISGNEGPREISLSAGIGIPIINAYNTRSMLNVAFSWQNYRALNYITENTLMVTIGLTFNERWFTKWKFE